MTEENKRPIAFFDSGVGGLTVFAKVKKLLPEENYLYFGDTKNMPYGEKTEAQLIDYADRIFKFFESENDMLKENFKIEMVKNLCLLIEENGKESLIYKIPIIRKKNWERPYYFKVTKKDLIAFIKNKSKKDIT